MLGVNRACAGAGGLHVSLRVVRAEKEDSEEKNGEVVPLVADALAHPALNPPDGSLTLMDTLRQYLLQLEFHLWGVLDRGWTGTTPPCALLRRSAADDLPCL